MYRSFSQFLEARKYWGAQGAGVLAIAVDTGNWLVALRSATVQEPNTWGGIGGKIDPADHANPQDAAKREFFEETGYAGPMSMMKAFVYQSPERDPITRTPIFTYHNFIGEIKKGRWEPKPNWETEQFAWVSSEELIDLHPKHYGLEALIRNSGDIIHALSEKHQ